MQDIHFTCHPTSQDQDLARGRKSDTHAFRYVHFSAEQGCRILFPATGRIAHYRLVLLVAEFAPLLLV